MRKGGFFANLQMLGAGSRMWDSWVLEGQKDQVVLRGQQNWVALREPLSYNQGALWDSQERKQGRNQGRNQRQS